MKDGWVSLLSTSLAPPPAAQTGSFSLRMMPSFTSHGHPAELREQGTHPQGVMSCETCPQWPCSDAKPVPSVTGTTWLWAESEQGAGAGTTPCTPPGTKDDAGAQHVGGTGAPSEGPWLGTLELSPVPRLMLHFCGWKT